MISSRIASQITTAAAGVSGLTNVGGTLYYVVAANGSQPAQLWKLFATGSTWSAAQIAYRGGSSPLFIASPSSLVNVNLGGTATLFFAASDGFGGSTFGLWRVAPADAIATLIQGSFVTAPVQLTASGPSDGSLFFVANGVLETSNGTTAQPVLDVNGKQVINPSSLTDLGGTLVLAVNTAGGNQLLKVVRGASAFVAQVVQAFSSATPVTGLAVSAPAAGSPLVYFQATDSDGLPKLWRSDGTAANTLPVFTPGSATVGSLTDVNGEMYFVVSDSVAGQSLWKSDGTAANTLRVTTAGALVGGSTPANLVSFNGQLYFTPQTPPIPQQQWVRQLGTSQYDYAQAVAVDRAGNSYIAGYTFGSLAAAGAGRYDAFVAKYDAGGKLLWSRQFGTSGDDFANSIAVDGAGNVYLAGYTNGSLAGTNAGGTDAWAAKYDTNGNLLWARQLGISDSDFAVGVAVDAAGNAYLVGHTHGALSGAGTGSYDIWVAKYDANGKQLWVQQFGTSSSDYAGGIAVDCAGNAYLAGYTYGSLAGTNAGSSDVLVAKYDTNGNQLWKKQFGTSGIDVANGIAVDAAGNAYLAGTTDGSLAGPNASGNDAWVAKYDASGNQLWKQQFGSPVSDYANGIAVDANGNAYLTGYTYGSLGGANAGGSDAWVAKYDATGNPLWKQQFGTSGNELANGITVDAAGNAYLAGTTDGSLARPNAGSNDAWVAKYLNSSELWHLDAAGTTTARVQDNLGVTLTATVLAGEGDNQVSPPDLTAATSVSQTVALTAASGVASLDLTAAIKAMLQAGQTRVKVRLSLSSAAVRLDVQKALAGPSGPAPGQTALVISTPANGVLADVYDGNGGLLAQGQSLLDLRNFQAGTYYVRVYNPNPSGQSAALPFTLAFGAPPQGQSWMTYNHPDRDVIHGGDGNDIIDGGPDLDHVFGDGGTNTLTADNWEIHPDTTPGDLSNDKVLPPPTVESGVPPYVPLDPVVVGVTSATSAAGTATVSGGQVTGVTLTNPGGGYVSPPAVLFSGSGSGAAGTALIANGQVVAVVITSAGTGYTAAPSVTFSGGAVTDNGLRQALAAAFGVPTTTAFDGSTHLASPIRASALAGLTQLDAATAASRR